MYYTVSAAFTNLALAAYQQQQQQARGHLLQWSLGPEEASAFHVACWLRSAAPVEEVKEGEEHCFHEAEQRAAGVAAHGGWHGCPCHRLGDEVLVY